MTDLHDGRPGSAPPLAIAALGTDPEGATPLDPQDLDDLVPAFVATRAELNLVEYEGILAALPWARDRARRDGPTGILDASFLARLHRRMFGDVWMWAGTLRARATSIGVPPVEIASSTRHALDDARWWHDHDTFPVDERAIRLHHRLVAIHPFPNGNGRCTRLLADLYLLSVGEAAFTWGGGSLARTNDARNQYLTALRAADAGDHEPLLRFARS